RARVVRVVGRVVGPLLHPQAVRPRRCDVQPALRRGSGEGRPAPRHRGGRACAPPGHLRRMTHALSRHRVAHWLWERRGAAALERGADVLVLDDAYRLLGVARDLNIVLVSAESDRASRWPLPAGPWREGWEALGRAGCIIVTRKRATARAAATLAARLARRRPGVPVAVVQLGLDHFEGLRSGVGRPLAVLGERRVVAAAGVADPLSFAVQSRSLEAARP